MNSPAEGQEITTRFEMGAWFQAFYTTEILNVVYEAFKRSSVTSWPEGAIHVLGDAQAAERTRRLSKASFARPYICLLSILGFQEQSPENLR
jgi:hypothetical protein